MGYIGSCATNVAPKVVHKIPVHYCSSNVTLVAKSQHRTRNVSCDRSTMLKKEIIYDYFVFNNLHLIRSI